MASIYAEEMRARAEQWVPAAYARAEGVTSADKAYQWMRTHDMYVPRQYVREAWAQSVRNQSTMDVANRLPWNELVPSKWMEETSFEYGRKYNYIVETEGFDPAQGETRKQTVTIVSDESLTMGEVFARAADAAFQYGVATALPSFSTTLVNVKFRG